MRALPPCSPLPTRRTRSAFVTGLARCAGTLALLVTWLAADEAWSQRCSDPEAASIAASVARAQEARGHHEAALVTLRFARASLCEEDPTLRTMEARVAPEARGQERDRRRADERRRLASRSEHYGWLLYNAEFMEVVPPWEGEGSTLRLGGHGITGHLARRHGRWEQGFRVGIAKTADALEIGSPLLLHVTWSFGYDAILPGLPALSFLPAVELGYTSVRVDHRGEAALKALEKELDGFGWGFRGAIRLAPSTERPDLGVVAEYAARRYGSAWSRGLTLGFQFPF